MVALRAWVAGSLLLLLVPLAPPSGLASSHEVAFSDPEGDAKSGPNGSAPASGGELARVVDLKRLVVGGESGFDVRLSFQVAALNPGPGYYAVNGATYTTCFQWSGTEGWFRVTLRVNYRYLPVTNVEPRLDWLKANLDYLTGECTPRAPVAWAGPPLEGTFVDAGRGLVTFVVPRADLAALAAGGKGLAGHPAPRAGDRLGSFFVEASADYNRNVLVSDRAPDSGAFPGAFVLARDTFNTDLRLEVDTNVQDLGERETRFAVSAGGYQAVPVRVVNRDARDHAVALSADLVQDHPHDSAWTVRIVPRLLVPAATPEGPGVRTATLIVETEPSVPHKEVARVLVTGSFEDRPQTMGAAIVDVVATVSPDAAHPTLFLHTMETEQGIRYVMNTLRDDPDASDEPIGFSTNAGGVETPRITRQAHSFRMDVPPTDDLVLDTLAPVRARLTFTSSPPVEAEVRAYLLNGEVELASGSVRASIDAGETPVEVEFLPRPPSRDATVVVWRFEPGVPFAFRYEFVPQPRQSNPVFGNSETGDASFVVKASDVTLPILGTTKRVGVNLTDSGALVSLAAEKGAGAHLNPGKTRVFNLTVQNEGVRRDTVLLSARLDATRGFRVAFDRTAVALEPGEGAPLRVLVTAPADAPEEERFEVTVVARSQRDARAEATALVYVVTTSGVDIADADVDLADFAAAGSKRKQTPDGAPLLAFLLLLVVVARSRKRWIP